MDIDKFKKIIAKTTSPWDGEALNAIRLANRMLEDERITWEQFLTRNNGHKEMNFDDLVREWAKESVRNPHARPQRQARPQEQPRQPPRPKSSEGFKKQTFTVRMKRK